MTIVEAKLISIMQDIGRIAQDLSDPEIAGIIPSIETTAAILKNRLRQNISEKAAAIACSEVFPELWER